MHCPLHCTGTLLVQTLLSLQIRFYCLEKCSNPHARQYQAALDASCHLDIRHDKAEHRKRSNPDLELKACQHSDAADKEDNHIIKLVTREQHAC